jgi:SPP1 gp7 family putative phage head morphogenesis protein
MQLAYKRTKKKIDARKEAYTQDRIRRGFERGITQRLINYFSKIGNGAAKALEESGTTGFDVYLSQSRPELEKVLKPHWYEVIKTFASRVDNYLFVKRADNAFFTELLDKFVFRVGANHISDIDVTTRKQLQRVLLAGQKDGLPLTEISKNIRERFSPKFSRSRSATIARTETHSAASFANHQQGIEYQKLQPNLNKQWVAVNDDRTREAHRIANGQIVPMDEAFIVDGRNMQYTGDPNGGAANVINCRCAVIYVDDETQVFDDTPPVVAPLPLPNPTPRAINAPLRLASLGPLISISRRTGPLRGKSQAEITRMYDKKLRDALTPITEKVYDNVPLPRLITIEGTTANPKGYYRVSQSRTRDKKLVANLEGQTLEHEYGHHIDFTTTDSGKWDKAWSETNTAFKNAFALDRAKLNELPPSTLKGFKQDLYVTEAASRINTATGREVFYLRETNKVKKEGYQLVSDIVDAMSAGRFQDNFSGWGHGIKYYRKEGMIYKETYANLFALQNNKEALAYVDKYFPNVSTVFKKRMLELAEDD